MFIKVSVPVMLSLIAAALFGGQLAAQNASAVEQVDISGYWRGMNNEFPIDNVAGPDLGDYGGFPLNKASRQRADTWDSSILSQPERQTHPHPAQYQANPRGPARITKIFAPGTQRQIGYAMTGGFGRSDRIVWTDGRPHPSEFSEHTWSGFSTGKWEDGVFVVTTTHLKAGWLVRNGIFSSPYVKMTEYFFRTGTEMTLFMWLDDPMTMEEPHVRTITLRSSPTDTTGNDAPFEAVDELGNRSLGWVPHQPLGTTHPQFAKRYGIPFEATQGGAATRLPEYQLRIQQLMQQQQTGPR